jgi:hypothetical protein
MAIRIAGACRVTELMDVLLASVLASDEDVDLKRFMAESLQELTPVDRLAELVPLAEGLGDDDDDNIKSSGLQALIPRHLSVGQAAPLLTPRKDSNHLGGYWTLLGNYIPTYIESADLFPLLDMLVIREGCFDQTSSWKAIADKTFCVALARLDEVEVADKFVVTWLAKTRGHHPLPLNNAFGFFTKLVADRLLRRKVVASLINSARSLEKEIWRSIPHELVVAADDLPWLLERLEAAIPTNQGKWVELIGRRINPDVMVCHWDLFLEAQERIPVLKSYYANLFRAWALDEDMARKAKATWLREQRIVTRLKRRQRPSVEPQIDEAVANALAGQFNLWVQLADLVFQENGRRNHGSEYFDITQSPAWTKANPARREEFATIARQFLMNATDVRPNDTLTFGTYAGIKAVYLLQEKVEHDSDLKRAVEDNWLEAILDSPVDSDHALAATGLAYRLNPSKVEERLARVLPEQGFEGRRMLRALKLSWNPRLSEIARGCLLNRPNAEIYHGVFKLLSIVDAPLALLTFDELVARYRDDTDPTTLRVVITAGLENLPLETWKRIKPLLQSNHALARATFLQVASSSEMVKETKSLTSTAEGTGEIYQLMSVLFPIADDPPFNGEMGSRHEAAVFRNRLLNHLAAMGTEAACTELRRLTEALPDQSSQMNWAYRECLTSMRKQLWRPAAPETILSMSENAHTRVIRDEHDLINVVLESLSRFQTNLTGINNSQVSALWNYDGAGNQRRHFRPVDEEDLSDRITGWLQTDLGPSRGIILNREVQPRRGNRTDILVQAIAPQGSTFRTLTVVIEVKGCWNTGVQTSLRTQLVDTYLIPNGWTHGIYLVGWFICERWENNRSHNQLSASTIDEAHAEVKQLATSCQTDVPNTSLFGYVLDCRLD